LDADSTLSERDADRLRGERIGILSFVGFPNVMIEAGKETIKILKQEIENGTAPDNSPSDDRQRDIGGA